MSISIFELWKNLKRLDELEIQIQIKNKRGRPLIVEDPRDVTMLKMEMIGIGKTEIETVADLAAGKPAATPSHSAACDVDPETLTWNRDFVKGTVARICWECAGKLK